MEDETNDQADNQIDEVDQRITESGDVLATGKLWEVILIRSGMSRNNRYYPPDVIREAVHLFAGVPIAAYTTDANGRIMDHLTDDGRDATEGPAGNVAGIAVDPHVVEIEGGHVEIRASWHCTSAPIRETAMAAVRSNVTIPFGLSIDGTGIVESGIAEGKKCLVVKKLTKILEVSLVTNPAAGGRITRLVASADDQASGEKSQEGRDRSIKMKNITRFLTDRGIAVSENVKEAATAAAEKLKEMDGDNALLQLALEFLSSGKTDEAILALEKALGAKSEPEEVEAPAMASKKAPVAESAMIAKLSKDLADVKKVFIVREAVASAPDAAKDFVARQLAKIENLTESMAMEVVMDARKLVAPAHDQGVEQVRIKVGPGKLEKIKAGLDVMFTGQIPTGICESQRDIYKTVLSGRTPRIAELYREFHDDHNMRGRDGEGSLREAVTGGFPYLVGTSMERQLVAEYRARAAEWREWVTINPDVDNFKLQERVVHGTINQLQAVSQGSGYGNTTYAYSDIGHEDRATYTVSKYGLLIGVTREMIKNDDMGALRRMVSNLAKASNLSVKSFVYKLLTGRAGGGAINSDTAYTGQVIYHASHGNVGTTALALQSLINAVVRMKNQREFGRSTTVTGAVAATDTTWPLASTVGFQAGDEFMIEGEVVTVVTVDSATQITSAARTGGTYSAADRVYQLCDQIDMSSLTLITPTELWQTANELISSDLKPGTANNDANLLRQMAAAGKLSVQDVHARFLGGTAGANDFYLARNPADGTGIEVAFMDNVQEPQLFLADDEANSTNMLNADQTTYKARLEFSGVVVDPRNLDGNIVA